MLTGRLTSGVATGGVAISLGVGDVVEEVEAVLSDIGAVEDDSSGSVMGVEVVSVVSSVAIASGVADVVVAYAVVMKEEAIVESTSVTRDTTSGSARRTILVVVPLLSLADV